MSHQWRSQKFSTGGASTCSIPFCPFPFSCPTKSAVQSKNVMTYTAWMIERTIKNSYITKSNTKKICTPLCRTNDRASSVLSYDQPLAWNMIFQCHVTAFRPISEAAHSWSHTHTRTHAHTHTRTHPFSDTIRYDTIRDAILTCARKPT